MSTLEPFLPLAIFVSQTIFALIEPFMPNTKLAKVYFSELAINMCELKDSC